MLSLVPFAVTASLNSHEGNKFFSGSPTLFWGTLLLTPIVLLPLYITLGKRKSGIKKARKAESFHYTLFFFFFFLKKKGLLPGSYQKQQACVGWHDGEAVFLKPVLAFWITSWGIRLGSLGWGKHFAFSGTAQRK